jgi:hypothetical protein
MPSVHGSNFNRTYVSELGNMSQGSVVRRSIRQFFNNMKKQHLGEINKDLNMFYNKVLYSLVKDSRLDQIAEDLFVAKYMLLYLNESIDYDLFSELPTIQNKLSELLAMFESKLISRADLEMFEKGLDEIYGFLSDIREQYPSVPVYTLNSNLTEFYKKHVKDIMKLAQGKPTVPAPKANVLQPIPSKIGVLLPANDEKHPHKKTNTTSVISNTSRVTTRSKTRTNRKNNTKSAVAKKVGSARTRKYRRSY